MPEQPKCEICHQPMPEGEEVFKYHGYSGTCPPKDEFGRESHPTVPATEGAAPLRNEPANENAGPARVLTAADIERIGKEATKDVTCQRCGTGGPILRCGGTRNGCGCACHHSPERPVTPQAVPLATNSGMGFGAPQPPVDVVRLAELEKYYDDALDYIDRGKAAEAKADSLLERIGELERTITERNTMYEEQLSNADLLTGDAEARADDLQRELDELKEYEAEEAAFMAKHNVSYCTTFVDGWARVLDDRDSLAETLGRYEKALLTIRDHERPFLGTECRAIAGAALGPVAGEGKN